MSFQPSGSMLKCLVISCFDLDSLVLKHMGLFSFLVEQMMGGKVEELRSFGFWVCPRMTPIFAKMGTQICSDLGGLAQILLFLKCGC